MNDDAAQASVLKKPETLLGSLLERAVVLENEMRALVTRRQEVEREAQKQIQQIVELHGEKSAEWLRVQGGIDALRAVMPPDTAGAE